jgi:hypothetical protein
MTTAARSLGITTALAASGQPVNAWTAHRALTAALDTWLGAGAPRTDRELAAQGLPDEETLVRALFQRWTTTLESCLEIQLELGDETGLDAVSAAYARAASHRPADWGRLREMQDHPVVADLSRRQHVRLARTAGLIRGRDIDEVVTEVARTLEHSGPVNVVPIRFRRLRSAFRGTARAGLPA